MSQVRKIVGRTNKHEQSHHYLFSCFPFPFMYALRDKKKEIEQVIKNHFKK